MGTEDRVVEELGQIKRLLILQLIRDGCTSEVIGDAVGVDSSTIRRFVPVRAAKKGIAREVSKSRTRRYRTREVQSAAQDVTDERSETP